MKILLVYSPFTHPMFPPSGIAYVKGFLNKNSPMDSVSCLDLNLEYYYKFLNKDDKLMLRNVIDAKEKNDISRGLDEIEKIIDKFDQKQEKNISLLKKYLNNEIKYTSVKHLLEHSYDLIKKYKADLVGFSILFKSQLVYSLSLAKLLKKKNKNIKIVFGGALFQKFSSFECSDIVKDNYPIDYIITDTGKTSFVDLIKSIKNKKNNTNKLLNLIYFDENKKKVKKDKFLIENYIRDFKKPNFPDYSDFNLKRYLTPVVSLPIELTLGCSWSKCKFCQLKKGNKGILIKDCDNFLEEIIFLKKQFNISYFRIIGAEVPSYILKILAEKIIKSGIKISYSVYARPVKKMDIDLLEKMKLSGCRTINYGVESFSQKVLDKMDKGTNVSDVIRVLKNTKKAKINTFCWYMIGFPGQTLGDLKKEFNSLKKFKELIDFFSCHPFQLINKSIIHVEQKEIIESKIKKLLFFEFEKRKFYDDSLIFQIKEGVSVEEARRWANKFQSYFDEYINKKNNKNNSSIMIKYFYR